MRAAHSSFVRSADFSVSNTPKTFEYFSHNPSISACTERYSSFSFESFAMTELRYSLKILLWTSTNVSNLNSPDTFTTSAVYSSAPYYNAQISTIQMCKRCYRSISLLFLSGSPSPCSGSVSMAEGSFSSRFSSMLRAFSLSVFSFSSSSKAKGFCTSTFAFSSCEMVSAFLVFAASSRAGSLASSFSIRVRFPRASEPNSTLCFAFPQRFRQ